MLEVVATGSEKKKFFDEMFLDILTPKKVFFNVNSYPWLIFLLEF